MKHCYADQKFNEALHSLVLTDGSLRERLQQAYAQLSPVLHQTGQIPPGLEEEWALIRDHKPLAELSEEEVRHLCEAIVEMAREVSFWSDHPKWQRVW